ncbi:MAG: Asp-tRNA(Asn)/Glu-tRNA(Gln) amidotransferase subunit GatB [Rhodobiaceae bacterium]|jgi:aspartyl-tRNA(Asn)/glutamyl-tRNA(Gln) amidotransferase subunit B|nr:Asp-tRNA(Asn)/Glu-tRNA(Gln) amidotransferase subunit GatB [Rhodobiaceae bacterium]MBT5641062.1 Asp-tRNA(Asn)/Glu-tRNA(Gln) amidotransferase subunit GatB [Rhodobiaceae bacterium]MBT6223138.1 Asp-tRNA(Asn)/Glu-tRNA(Gln) amidotransferase subunit GatB [Rhodobiaceae bacterium]
MSEIITTNEVRHLVQGGIDSWEIIIGLEIHAQVVSNSKLFSGSSTSFGSNPMSQVSLVDAAMPGMLPVINEECVRQAVKTGLGLQAKINNTSVFDRKNYFYPDLPQGYQISQFKYPIVGEGEVAVDFKDKESIVVNIERLHLEQDAGKSIHDLSQDYSYIDLNRSGVALMEIVTKPDLRSAEEAKAFVTKLRTILRYLGTCDGNMEQGSLRADVNVSVRKPGDALGIRCEIKNVNSIRFIGQAIDYEAGRQIDILEEGGIINQETRLFDSATGKTRAMRSKEEAHDYRYFPDPDLLPLYLSDDFIKQVAIELPELPDQKKARFINDYGLTSYDASILVADRVSSEFFEGVAKGRDIKLVVNWITGELFASLNRLSLDIANSPITIESLGQLIDLISDKTLSGRLAKDVFEIMLDTKEMPKKIVEEKGLSQITDMASIEVVVDKVILENPDKVAELLEKPKLIGWFVGQIMKETAGKANPANVNKILRDKLKLG